MNLLNIGIGRPVSICFVIIGILALLMLLNGCGTKCVNTMPVLPVPNMSVVNAVEASPSEDLQRWFFLDFQAYWDKIRAREK